MDDAQLRDYDCESVLRKVGRGEDDQGGWTNPSGYKLDSKHRIGSSYSSDADVRDGVPRQNSFLLRASR